MLNHLNQKEYSFEVIFNIKRVFSGSTNFKLQFSSNYISFLFYSNSIQFTFNFKYENDSILI